MKKIISVIAALSMLMSMTAFAAIKTDSVYTMTADKKTAKVGDVITYSVDVSADSDTTHGLFSAKLKIAYDATQISIDESSITTYAGFTGNSSPVTLTESTLTINPAAATKTDTLVHGAINVATFKATVKEGATGTIKFVASENAAVVVLLPKKVAQKDTISIAKFPEVTIVGDEPEKPVISVDPSNPVTGENNGIVDINTNAETGAYSVKVKAPIGKKAVIYLNGEAQTGSEISGTATADTTIKVEYVDVADEVITYVVPMSSIYGAEETGIAAFGKGTIAEGVAYGIKFGGLTGTYKDITDYKFPAKGNVGGIFGVEVKDAPAGDYTAQAYVGDTMGAAISFTK